MGQWGFGAVIPSLGKFLACRQVAWPSPHLHLPTYLGLLDFPAHIGRDSQTGLLFTQWHHELAHLAQVLGHCRDRERETFSIQGSPFPWPDAPALISPAKPLPLSSDPACGSWIIFPVEQSTNPHPYRFFSLQSEANGAKKNPQLFPHLPFTPPWASKR